MKADKLVESIADSLERRFEGVTGVEALVSDIIAINEGYMEEEQAGAMVVDLIKAATEKKLLENTRG